MCLEEWQLARAAARHEALGQQRHTPECAVEHLLRKPDGRGLPYVISVGDQRQVGLRWRRRALWFALGFLAAGILAGWLALVRVGL